MNNAVGSHNSFKGKNIRIKTQDTSKHNRFMFLFIRHGNLVSKLTPQKYQQHIILIDTLCFLLVSFIYILSFIQSIEDKIFIALNWLIKIYTQFNKRYIKIN